MRTSSFAHRFLIPVLPALVVLILSRIVYSNAYLIDHWFLYPYLAMVSGAIYFVSVVLAALFLYPVTYFRGATDAERVIACSLNLAIWIVIDTWKVSEAFTCLESLYYGINIGAVLITWNLAQMGILELACRFAVKRRGQPIRVFTPLPFVPVLVLVLVVYLLSREGGEYYFSLLLDGYLAIFRP